MNKNANGDDLSTLIKQHLLDVWYGQEKKT